MGFAGNSEIYDFSKYFDFAKNGNYFAWEKNYSLEKLIFFPQKNISKKELKIVKLLHPKNHSVKLDMFPFCVCHYHLESENAMLEMRCKAIKN